MPAAENFLKQDIFRFRNSLTLTIAFTGLLIFPASIGSAQSFCQNVPAPNVEYAQGSANVEQNKTVSGQSRVCLPAPQGVAATQLTLKNAALGPNGVVQVFPAGQSTVSSHAVVLSFSDSVIAAGSGDFVSGYALPFQLTGKLRVNIFETTIGSGRSMTFQPFNGTSILASEVYFAASNALTYDDLTITGATKVGFGAAYGVRLQTSASDFSLTNSSISSTDLIEIYAGTTVTLDAGTSLNSFSMDVSGTLAGSGTYNGLQFSLKNGGGLAPGASIGTLTLNSDLQFDTGSKVISEVDPANGQNADLVTAAGNVTGINNTTFQIEAARSGLSAQDYVAGGTYRVLDGASVDGDAPTIAAGASLPALSNVVVANTPTADGYVDIEFQALPVVALAQATHAPQSQSAQNIVSNVATTANTNSTSTLQNGSQIGAAVNNLTGSQLSQFSLVHAEPYSSNLTVGLERQNLLSNTVMDHAVGAGEFTGNLGCGDLANTSGKNAKRGWGDVRYVSGSVEGDSNLGSFGYNISQFVVGMDIAGDCNGGFGVFMAGGDANLDEHDEVDQTFSNSTASIGLYGHRILENDLQITGSLGLGLGKSETTRVMPSTIGQFTGGTATADFDTHEAFAGFRVHRSYEPTKSRNFFLSPSIGVTYLYTKMDQVQETGTGDFIYQIDSADAESLIFSPGIDLTWPLASARNMPSAISASFRYEYDALADKNGAHEVTATSPIFGTTTQVGQNRGAHGARLGVSYSRQIGKNSFAGVSYDAAWNSNATEHRLAANVTLNW
jgi:autotransporter-like protein